MTNLSYIIDPHRKEISKFFGEYLKEPPVVATFSKYVANNERYVRDSHDTDSDLPEGLERPEHNIVFHLYDPASAQPFIDLCDRRGGLGDMSTSELTPEEFNSAVMEAYGTQFYLLAQRLVDGCPDLSEDLITNCPGEKAVDVVRKYIDSFSDDSVDIQEARSDLEDSQQLMSSSNPIALGYKQIIEEVRSDLEVFERLNTETLSLQKKGFTVFYKIKNAGESWVQLRVLEKTRLGLLKSPVYEIKPAQLATIPQCLMEEA